MITNNINHSKIKDNSTVESLSTSIGQLIMHLKQLERHPRIFGEEFLLTPSEAHTIHAIGINDGMLMSELAARLAVSKGAVTQMISRLEKKGFVCRGSHPTDSRSIIVRLTKIGLLAHKAHSEFDQNLYEKFSMQINPQEIEIFTKCVDKLCKVLHE